MTAGAEIRWDDSEVVDGLRLERRDCIALLRIECPGRSNALTARGFERMVSAWEAAQEDRTVRVLVVTAARDPDRPAAKQAFCAGFDAADQGSGELPGRGGEIPSLATVAKRTPSIVAIDGHCVGAGVGMMLAGDLRIATPHSTFWLPEVELGIVPGNDSVRQLLAQAPRPLAVEMLLMGRRLEAARALEVGLLNAVVDPDDLQETALAWAERLAALDSEALGAAAAMMAAMPRLSGPEAAAMESETIQRLVSRERRS